MEVPEGNIASSDAGPTQHESVSCDKTFLSSVSGSRKTVEGTAGGVAVTLAAWAALLAAAGGGTLAAVAAPGAAGWSVLAAATVAACLLEASTTQLDNVFVPLHLFALLCLL